MGKQKKQSTLTRKVVIAWMVVLALSNIIIGTISYSLYKSHLYESRAIEAQNVAVAMAARIDGDQFTEIMATLEKNDYWYEVKEYADRISVLFQTAFIYILDDDYTDEVTYFAEGAPGDAPFDLGMTEVIEGIYSDEMFVTLATGEPTFTDAYPSGDYGEMVSGFGAITNAAGEVVGVVGVDFFYEDIMTLLRTFTLTVAGIVVAFLVLCYFLMTYAGTTLAGTPLSRLDKIAQRLAVGDMRDIDFSFIKSTTEIGRLAASFAKMIDAMKEQVSTLETLSQGDLTMNIDPRGQHDIMGHAIVQILSNLNGIFSEINQSALLVSSGAHKMSDNAQSLAVGTNEQSDAVGRLSASISEVTDKANKNLEVAAKTNKLTDAIKADAQIGSEQMSRMTHAVKDITDASLSISKVIKVIDDIAFQTNILALNAAVEAARAGQHGKGFAVVAEEVRNLAAKSAEAAKETGQLITDSMEKAQLGAAISDETAASLGRIIKGVNECAELVEELAGSFDEQIDAMHVITKDVEQVAQVVKKNSEVAEESAAASQEMSSQSSTLEELVSQFKLKNDGGRLKGHSTDSLPPYNGQY